MEECKVCQRLREVIEWLEIDQIDDLNSSLHSSTYSERFQVMDHLRSVRVDHMVYTHGNSRY